jgi:hypothetical protein
MTSDQSFAEGHGNGFSLLAVAVAGDWDDFQSQPPRPFGTLSCKVKAELIYFVTQS